MAADNWDKMKAGQGCAFDAPRADNTAQWDLVARLSVSSWYLPQNQMYRGHALVIFDPRHAARIDELTSDEWQAYAADVRRVTTIVVAVCRPDHINIEALGNATPHLHFHVVPRYKNDGRWGRPIWESDGTQQDRRLAADDRERLLAALRAEL